MLFLYLAVGYGIHSCAGAPLPGLLQTGHFASCANSRPRLSSRAEIPSRFSTVPQPEKTVSL